MRPIFARKLRLKPSILTLFILLTVPVLSTIIAVNYFSNDSSARANARELVERFRTDAIDNIQGDIDPIRSLVRSAASIGNQLPEFYSDDRSLRYFFSLLLHSDKIVSFYVGLEDGSFRQTRRVDPTARIFDKLPPIGARYAYRWVLPSKDGLVDRYLFLDADAKELGTYEQATSYDPRPRLWYRSTIGSDQIVVTDPDVFAALGLIGFTVAQRFRSRGQVLGVAAADITLDGFSEYLSRRKVSPGTLSYILDHQGRVIANSDLSRTYANDKGKVELSHITALENELPAVAYGARARQHEQLYEFKFNGRDYLGSLATLPRDFGQRWQLFIITPLDDFTRSFQASNNQLLLFGVIATLLQIVVIYFLTGVVSAPLEKLARKVNRIQELEGESPQSPPSSIREISVLSRAIDQLDSAVRSFAAFVPVGLVKQLLESDQKLELGGHSRFLTIFFSDLEAFSTLSEEVPSQDLLLRVSAYLQVVTKAVNQEHGTIDKFIGDGVMAFWGAPALLEDHAWRACVAALRIQRGMEELNAQWVAEGLKPFNVRIGIHCDAVLVGNIGSKERMSYTVMGDGVNIAARLEGLNKEFRTRVCISHSVFKEAGERLCVRPIDDVVVKGRRGKIAIYELVGVYGAGPELEPCAEALRLSRLTRSAYEALIRDDQGLALERYKKVLVEFPEDTVSSELVKRLVAPA
jgi:adenylate cyclase